MPNSKISTRYILRAHVRGPLGNVERDSSLLAMVPGGAPTHVSPVPAAGQAVHIGTLSVSPSPVRAGAPLKVAYETNAVAGEVRLTDLEGRTWAHDTLQSSGVSWLHVPPELAGREVRVVVVARGAHGDATSSIGAVVSPATDAAVAAKTRIAAPVGSLPTLSLSKETVPSGYAFSARVSGSSGAVRVALTDAGGSVISQRDATSGDAVTMTAPHVRSATTYYVIATVKQGSGEQSLVRKLLVAPHLSRP